MANKNYYDILRVSKTASADEIKSAYRKLAKQYHPDLHPNDEVAASKFKEISEAYEVLGDEQKRKNYDQFGSPDGNPFGANSGGFGGFSSSNFGGGFGGFDDLGGIFGDIFGAFGGSSGSKQSKNTRGDDINLKVNISFMEACTGVKKSISVSRIETCEFCSGTGAKTSNDYSVCPTCNGTGQVRYTQQTFLGRVVNVGTCQDCNGTGKIIKNKCEHCGGTGTVRKTRTINVQIPAGIDNDQILSIKNEGHANGTNGAKGDLKLLISVGSHPVLKRDGFDLIVEVPLPFTISLLGGKIKVPAINETIELVIPPLTQTNTTFNIKGKGITKLGHSTSRGDLKVKVVVEMPKSLDRQTKELLSQVADNIGSSSYAKYRDYLSKIS